MGALHDSLASSACSVILKDLMDEGTGRFRQVFSSDIRRVGFSGWPEPDFVLNDYENNSSIAIEFKPPKQTKREYVTGLGQAATYTHRFNYGGLVVPELSDDGFRIADYLTEVANQPEFSNLPICIFSYANEDSLLNQLSSSLNLIKPIRCIRTDFTPPSSSSNEGVFWAWWRDNSHYEVYDLLLLADKYRGASADIYSSNVWPEFWQLLSTKKTRDWEGNFRNVTSSPNSHKQNYKIPLFRLGLIDESSGELTDSGYDLLKIGKISGANSASFKDELAKRVLIDGKHLELIQYLVDYTQSTSADNLDSSSAYLTGFEEWLDKRGLIPKRKPGRVTSNAKSSFIRDEPKLWNKLGLLLNDGSRYFFKDKGYNLDVSKIIRLCLSSGSSRD
jgi:hypothetical protein